MGGSVRTQTLTALLCLGHPCNSPSDSFPGYLPKPSIRADPSPNVTRGTPVTIWCQASLQADVYYLYKEGDKASFSLGFMSAHNAGRYQWNVSLSCSSPHPWQNLPQALFPVGPVSTSHGGTYRCYASSSTSPYLLSHPSDPLELLVSDSHSKDYTVENLIRMGMAGLILMVLGILLFWDHSSQRRIQDEARR
uniref:Ig-like domain-containing protein n=1 Tax=Lynx canadensis TaxID=61383 RepID=A0A667I7M5_LYNCA